MRGPIRERSSSPYIHKSIINEQSISIFAEHTGIIPVAYHPLDALIRHFIPDVLVDIFGLAMLEKFYPLEHCLGEWETVGVGGRDAEVGFRDGGFGDWVEEDAFDYGDFFLAFWWHL